MSSRSWSHFKIEMRSFRVAPSTIRTGSAANARIMIFATRPSTAANPSALPCAVSNSRSALADDNARAILPKDSGCSLIEGPDHSDVLFECQWCWAGLDVARIPLSECFLLAFGTALVDTVLIVDDPTGNCAALEEHERLGVTSRFETAGPRGISFSPDRRPAGWDLMRSDGIHI